MLDLVITILKNVFSALDWIGSIASIVALGISIWVLFSVQKIRSAITTRIRLPEIRKMLKRHVTTLEKHVTQKRWTRAASSLAECDAHLFSLSRWVKERAVLQNINNTRHQIAEIRINGMSGDSTVEVMRIIGDLKGIIQTVEHIQKDKQWT